MRIRRYRPHDARHLLDLFRETVRRVNSRDYDSVQIAAWASDEINLTVWTSRFDERFAVVAIDDPSPAGDERLAGFADMELDGHLDRLFVSADHQRRGVGRMLLEAVVVEAQRLGLVRVFTEASITARPFFAAHEFTTLAEQTVVCRGTAMTNFRMERRFVG
ncbi:MAG: GNAT family N-acetyltransferase [Pirellulales bacterium]